MLAAASLFIAALAGAARAECWSWPGTGGGHGLRGRGIPRAALRGNGEFHAVTGWLGDNLSQRLRSYQPPGPPRAPRNAPALARAPVEATDVQAPDLAPAADALAASLPRSETRLALRELVGSIEAQDGFRKNNLAAALAFALVASANMTSGGQSILVGEEADILATSVNDALAPSSELAEMTPPRRAAAYGAILACTSLMLMTFTDAVGAGDKAAVKSAQRDARDFLDAAGW